MDNIIFMRFTQLNRDIRNTYLASGTILDFAAANNANRCDLFIRQPYYPSDNPPNELEGYVQILRGPDGIRIVVLFYAYDNSVQGRIWMRPIYHGEWRGDWVRVCGT